MANLLAWDATASRHYETGVDRAVLFPVDTNGDYDDGVVWNGLISVSESPSGAEPTPLYADNIKYLNLMSVEEFGATLEAYTYPDAFAVCDGSVQPTPGLYLTQQIRRTFGLCYRTLIGNDVDGQGHGYKLHLIYGALASPSEKGYQSINDSPEAITFSWEITTTSVAVATYSNTALLVIDSTLVGATELAALEVILYGTAAVAEPVEAAVPARLPLPAEVITLITPAG